MGGLRYNFPMTLPFDSIYRHGFIRVAVCIPPVRVADPAFNVAQTVALAREASDQRCAVALFPELGPFRLQQRRSLPAGRAAGANADAPWMRWSPAEHDLWPVLLVGAPLRFEGKLFNCAVVIYRGSILGVVPKTYLPNYREFYEQRQFASARARRGSRR